MDLISSHSDTYVVTDHVVEEIVDFYEDQKARLTAALKSQALRELPIADPAELDLFSSLYASGRLGAGECSAIAMAINRGHHLAIDDRRAANEARRVSKNLKVRRTQELVTSMIHEHLLDVHEADAIKEVWARQHHFRLTFGSFQELLDQG